MILFECAHCNASYESGIVLNEHIRNVHQPPRFACKNCSYVTSDTSNMIKHYATHGKTKQDFHAGMVF